MRFFYYYSHISNLNIYTHTPTHFYSITSSILFSCLLLLLVGWYYYWWLLLLLLLSLHLNETLNIYALCELLNWTTKKFYNWNHMQQKRQRYSFIHGFLQKSYFNSCKFLLEYLKEVGILNLYYSDYYSKQIESLWFQVLRESLS